MKKVFISQPMRDRSQDVIKRERDEVIIKVEGFYEESVKIINQVMEQPSDSSKPLKLLAKSLELMADADVVVFVKGWENYRGCKIEHDCAFAYGISIIEL